MEDNQFRLINLSRFILLISFLSDSSSFLQKITFKEVKYQASPTYIST